MVILRHTREPGVSIYEWCNSFGPLIRTYLRTVDQDEEEDGEQDDLQDKDDEAAKEAAHCCSSKAEKEALKERAKAKEKAKESEGKSHSWPRSLSRRHLSFLQTAGTLQSGVPQVCSTLFENQLWPYPGQAI